VEISFKSIPIATMKSIVDWLPSYMFVFDIYKREPTQTYEEI
jgi:hypothetical protein